MLLSNQHPLVTTWEQERMNGLSVTQRLYRIVLLQKKTENLLWLTVFIFDELILIETKNKYYVGGFYSE